MAYSYEQLAQDFARIPVEIHGVFRTELEASQIYDGHNTRPTTKCALILGLRGQAEFRFEKSESFKLEQGLVLLGGLGKRLDITTGPEGFEYILVHYLPYGVQMEEARSLTEVALLHAEPDPEQLQLMDRITQAASTLDSLGPLEKKTLFYQLLNKVLQSERHFQNKDSYTAIDESLLFIHTHFAQPLTLSLLAERCDMKAKYFSYLFRKYVGLGPIDYLIRYRMNRANELLSTGQFSVADVARSVGYLDAYYFSRLFKKHIGISPGAVGLYRRRNHPL
ncbi:AraC family transcriptional regulator [Paenibacillus albus]|uniref:AraC family transcriptional regulator n=1 Tax=Paenibacillus albus TaxID=2495582 RepID=A0A3S8ZZR0_9BACL|nr:AraC family transcriptional regulator [Paenibacillus albus]AZN38999.1 AraC family transcriptional regulator [Paenibacillus albus]